MVRRRVRVMEAVGMLLVISDTYTDGPHPLTFCTQARRYSHFCFWCERTTEINYNSSSTHECPSLQSWIFVSLIGRRSACTSFPGSISCVAVSRIAHNPGSGGVGVEQHQVCQRSLPSKTSALRILSTGATCWYVCHIARVQLRSARSR